MHLTWFGQAAFKLTPEGGGPAVITDPYTPELLGYAPIEEGADVVIRSSPNDRAHCRADLIPGTPPVAEALDAAQAAPDGIGRGEAGGLAFEAILAMEGPNRPEGDDPDQNAMYRFEMDGMRIAHMGDIGNDLTPRQTDFLRGADVLLCLAGGGLVVRLDEVDRVIRETAPRVVIPMHFRTLNYRPRNGEWISAFLGYHDEADVDFAFGPRARLTRDALPDRTRILVMDYLR
ncbi:MAG: MBL fold metallo-hydrolase [Hasllibacter sp.]